MDTSRLFQILLLVYTLFTSVQSVAQNHKQTVKTGLIIPLTGGQAARGQDVTHLVEIMKESLNSQGSKKYVYDFIIEDGKCGAGNATTSAVSKLIYVDKVNFLITGCSGETLQAGPIAEKNKVLTIAVLSLHKDVKHLGEYIFRNFIDAEKSFTAFAEFMSQDSNGKIAILTEENAFTFGIRDLFLKKLGGQIVYAEDFAADSADFNSILLKTKQKKPAGIYLNVMSEGTLANIVNQVKKQGLQQRLYTYNMPEIESFRQATGSNSDDIYFVGTPEFTSQTEGYENFVKEYYKRYPQGPNYEFLLRTTFDAINALVDTAENAGLDPVKARDFLYSYKKQGALGNIQYDQNGDIENLHYVIRKMRSDGRHEVFRQLVNQ